MPPKYKTFQGVRYRRSPNGYYRHRGPRPDRETTFMHRAVWEHHNGPIPEDYDIHHIDGDPSNNSPDNLKAISHAEHRRLHAEEEWRDPSIREDRLKPLQERADRGWTDEERAKVGRDSRSRWNDPEKRAKMVEAMRNADRGDECRNGHKYTPDNTYTRSDGYRGCRTCQRAASRRYRERQRAKEDSGGH